MSVLESLRKRSGLLVSIVGIALLAFVLTSLFEGGSSIFGDNADKYVGTIAGKGIEYAVFNKKVQESIENSKANSGKSALDEAETDQIIQQTWNQFINQEVIEKEYEKLGVTVSPEELYDLMVEHPHSALVRTLVDPQTGKAGPRFADPQTGQLSPAKIKEFTASMKPEEEQQWIMIEDYVRQVRISEKYNNLIKKGVYVTTSAAKREYVAQNKNVNIKFIGKNLKQIDDNAVKYTDADLSAYYNAHQNDFKQVASRKIEYVAFDILPSQEDIQDAQKNMEAVTERFKSNKAEEDSTFVVAESDSRNFDVSFHTKGTLSPAIDSVMFSAAVGTVVGPYTENNVLKTSKLIATKTSADSGKVRHILISYKGAGASETVTRTKEQAKTMADSLLGQLKKGAKFADYVELFSDDNGKRMPPNKKEGEDYTGKGGNYGWLNANSSFVEPFKNAALDNKKGSLLVVESNFGYHIMEVLDSKGAQKKVQVATIERRLEPSNKTMQNIFVQASEFAGKNNTAELFQKAVADGKLNKRVVESIKETDKTIPGLESPRALIRWVYEKEKGTVSEPMELGSKFVVAVIADVKEKGVATLEQAKEEVTARVIKEKKAELIAAEMASAGAQIDAIASKLGLTVEQAQNINFTSTTLGGLGNQPAVIGAVCALKPNTLSKPIVGRDGVFVAYVESVTDAPAQKDYKMQQTAVAFQIQPRVDNDVYEALKTNANIEEHLVKFY
ncbi:MAG: SurA N-terminal domain-containing protein [Bacteroidia bacterium]